MTRKKPECNRCKNYEPPTFSREADCKHEMGSVYANKLWGDCEYFEEATE